MWANNGLAHRPLAVGRRGVIASAHQLATTAGMQMLMQGGNAVDAAVATAAALNVAEPYMSGIAGVGYMMVFEAKTRTLHVLNYTGTAPMAARPEAFVNRAEQEHGPKSPMVPGACAGWLTALASRGRLDRATVFAPAIEYAENGIPLTPRSARFYEACLQGGHLDDATKAVFFPSGTLPPSGTIIKQPKLAETYRQIAADGIDTFYRGAIANEIVATVQRQGGLLSQDDLESFEPFWESPISVDYRGFRVSSAPAPCAGIQYLQTLKLLEAYDLAGMGPGNARATHLLLEAMKLAMVDRIHYAPLGADCPTDELLSDEYIATRRALIDEAQVGFSAGERYDGQLTDPRAIPPGTLRTRHKLPESTTHFDVIDSDGNAVAVTQSLGDGFGSGVMAGSTGLMLNNFNYWFDSDPNSPNAIGPGKRIEMCMAPAAITNGDGSLLGMIGTPGSFGIMQTTPQMIINLIDHRFSVQAAIEAPRVRAYEANTIEVEARVPKSVRDDLARRGHAIRLLDEWSHFVGGGQGAMIDPESGARYGGADPRRDGVALAY